MNDLRLLPSLRSCVSPPNPNNHKSADNACAFGDVVVFNLSDNGPSPSSKPDFDNERFHEHESSS